LEHSSKIRQVGRAARLVNRNSEEFFELDKNGPRQVVAARQTITLAGSGNDGVFPLLTIAMMRQITTPY
jgi:hypothetical protein